MPPITGADTPRGHCRLRAFDTKCRSRIKSLDTSLDGGPVTVAMASQDRTGTATRSPSPHGCFGGLDP